MAPPDETEMDTVLFTEETTVGRERVGFAVAQRGLDWLTARYAIPVEATETEADRLREEMRVGLLEHLANSK